MADFLIPKQAVSMLEKQIELLGELRNAGTRAPEFREWRQTTLTVVERMWPDQSTRALRFRRIPFSPASVSADDKYIREAFERGCAEARRLLKLWLAEITTRGVSQEAEAPRLAEAVRATVNEAALQPNPQPKPAGKGGKAGKKKKAPLKEMLGLSEFSPEEPHLPPELAHNIIELPAEREARRHQQQSEGDDEAQAADELGDVLRLSIDHALERAQTESRVVRKPEPARPEPPAPPAPRARTHDSTPAMQEKSMVSYVARVFISMAADVEDLGVPEGHRERVRLALLDLAHHLDCGSVTWVLLRDAITLVMHYPALGRQAVPLLLPYLENAA
jgi:hypothetical protein